MCDIGTAISVGLTLAGSAAQAQAQKKASKAQEAAVIAEQQRQSRLQQEGAARLAQTQTGFTKENQEQALVDTAAARNVELQKSITAANPYVPTSGSAPTIVQTEIAKRLSDALAEGRSNASRLATLGAWGENTFNNKVDLNRSGQDIATLGSFMAGSANVLPLELNAASQKGQNLSTIGEILGAAGTVTGMAAAKGWNPFATSQKTGNATMGSLLVPGSSTRGSSVASPYAMVNI